MQQLSNNVAMLSGEPIPPGFEDSIKIALMGTSDLSPSQVGGWQEKFAQGVVGITNPEPGKGIVMYRGMNFCLLNCKSYGSPNQQMTYDNPDFVNKMSLDLDYAMAADAIFFNFLKKSVAPLPLLQFSTLATCEKLVVRCPVDYQNYGYVRVLAERYNIPLLPGTTTSVLMVLQTMMAFIPKLAELQKYKLPDT